MRYIELCYFQLPWVTPNCPKPPHSPHFCLFRIFVVGGITTSN